jgi:hypothetical protein
MISEVMDDYMKLAEEKETWLRVRFPEGMNQLP